MERQIDPQPVDQPADLARGLHALHGQPFRLQVPQGVRRFRALTDQLAVQAVPPAQAGHQRVAQPGQPRRGLAPAAQGGDQPDQLVDGDGEQRRLRVAVAEVGHLAEPVQQAHADRRDVLARGAD